ncbi:MAG TPA: hypothetical protein VIY47_09205 [Ignavibacteriaceae bacterium]
MKKIILTDADGVLVTWLAEFQKFMASKGYELIPDTEHHYSMEDRYHITTDQSRDLIREYNESAYMAYLPSYKDSAEYIGKLVNHGFRFICITSISSNPISKIYRRANLENLFGEIFDDVICLEMGSKKGPALLPWEGTGFFWIEDHIKNAEAGYQLGLRSILVQQDHNQHYDTEHFPIVGPENPWREIYRLVCKEYNLPI